MQAFLGTGTALVTPFKKDKSIDVAVLEQLVEFQIESGVEYLVVLGTTAETVTLSSDEKELVKQTIVNKNNGRVPLVLGVGGNHTLQVVSELKGLDLAKFDAVLSVSPYYNKPSQEGIYQHYVAVSEASSVPVIIYNVPGRTSSNISPETVLRLAEDCSNIIGVKEAAGDLVQAMKLLQILPKDFLVISGDDMIALPMTLAGGSGVISVLGQAYPKDFSQMIRLGLENSVEASYKLHYKLMNVIDLIFEEGNPVGIKALLEMIEGVKVMSGVRLPLVSATESLQLKLKKFVDTY
jgi:4-hydroxy-tetrahydrodipicolinate synthase